VPEHRREYRLRLKLVILRIFVTVDFEISVPLKLYGGIERIVAG